MDDDRQPSDADERMERFEAVFQFAGVGIAVADRTGRLVDVNPAFAQIVGVPRADLLGQQLTALFDVAAAVELHHAVTSLGSDGEAGAETFQIEAQVAGSGQPERWTMLTLTRIVDGAPCVLSVGMDITEQRQLRARLRDQAMHDSLTGLPNRACLEERLDSVLHDRNRQVGVCFADLDGFKQINDIYGHSVGDRLLVAIAHRLVADLASDRLMVGRIGGDEFVALVFDPTGLDELARVADAMLAACSRPFAVDNHELAVSASIGVVMPDRSHTRLDDLVRAADVGLYRAKEGGRGRWHLPPPPDTSPDR
jgi:diguanylate cyclase (GGDEF)-like protein/PAS domain S-box-containing protein